MKYIREKYRLHFGIIYLIGLYVTKMNCSTLSILYFIRKNALENYFRFLNEQNENYIYRIVKQF